MIKLLSMPGCPRAKSVRQLLKEQGIEAKETGIYQVLCDASRHQTLLASLQKAYSCTLEDLLDNPSGISRPLLAADLQDEKTAEDFFDILAGRDFGPMCTKKCPKHSVCPAAMQPVLLLTENGFKECGQIQ